VRSVHLAKQITWFRIMSTLPESHNYVALGLIRGYVRRNGPIRYNVHTLIRIED
jgi:hypothetical protein